MLGVAILSVVALFSNQPNDATTSLTAKEPMNKDWIKTFHSVPSGNVNI
jgi:hypothetical protein